MKTTTTVNELRNANWTKNSSDWYWFHPDTSDTHIHLVCSTHGSNVTILAISIKVNDVGKGKIWNGTSTNWGLLDTLNAADSAFFRAGLNAIGVH